MLNRPEAQQNAQGHLSLMDRTQTAVRFNPLNHTDFRADSVVLCRFPHISTPLCFQRSVLD